MNRKKHPSIGSLPARPGKPLLVGVVADPGWESAAWAAADLLELRLDRFLARPAEGGPGTGVQGASDWISRVSRDTGKPLLLTLRHPSESDSPDCEPVEDRERAALIVALLPLVQAIDVEVGAPYAGEVAARARHSGRCVIGSWHDFRRTPPERLIYQKMRRAAGLGADIFKLACRVDKPGDALSILSFGRYFGNDLPLALAPMGPRSGPVRLAAPFFGSVLVYGSLGEKTAPGQPGVSDLRADLDRFYR